MTSVKDDGSDTLDEALKDKARIEELSSDDDQDFGHAENDAAELDGVPFPGKSQINPKRQAADLPPWLQATTLKLFHDNLQTTTTEAQLKTTAECLP